MTRLKITDVERTWVSVPLKERHARHLTRENWDWTVFEVLKVHTDAGLTGVGETMCYYTWGRVPQEQVDGVIGRSPFDLLDDDRLGAGLQMAIYDLAGKALEVPCYRLFGPKVREECPISWWANDMSTEDWCEEIREALGLGYMSAKLKARPWRDVTAQMRTLAGMVPSDFFFDSDFNAFLRDAAAGVPYLLELERAVPAITVFESPIPQGDVAGNARLRRGITRAVAMHYGSPPIETAIREDVCDGFVIGGGVRRVREQGSVAAAFNKPFWLQMVGTGLTTALMLHLAATLTHATWPAVTCHEIYQDDLITERLPIAYGYARVPEAPGLGVTLDEEAVARYRVEEGYRPPAPRNLYRVSWPSGLRVTYRPGKEGMWDDFAAGNRPLFHPGVDVEILADDGSREWAGLNERAHRVPIRE